MIDPNCIFCKIVAGEIPSHKVYEDEQFLAFLEINPIKLGHTLLVTKEHYATVYDMPKELFCGFMNTARKIAPAIKSATACRKVGLSIVELDMDHAHLHVLPLVTAGDTNFENQKPSKSEELANMAEKIRDAILK